MVKKTIEIHKIKGCDLVKKADEVAIEYEMNISLKNGSAVHVTCTPAYLEEMVLARRYLAGDLSMDEKKKLGLWKEENGQQENTGILSQVPLEEIFRIARDFFENPGPLFVDTGCAHSCALIYQGEVVCCIEDIGRHNALDKVIGYALKHRIPISGSYIFSSGRISADYLQKAVDAGFRMVVSRAAVTDAAAALAQEKGITLLGFIRKNTGNIYCEKTVSLIL